MSTELEEKGVVSLQKGKKLDKRQAIIEAARELFTTEGYETTTIAQVAKKAGVAVGTVYLYFKNKNELLFGIQNNWEIEFIEAMSQPKLLAIPPHLRTRPLVEACFEQCRQQSDMVQVMGVSPQMVGELQPKEGNLIIQAISVFLQEGIEQGSFRPIDPEVGAAMAFGMVHQALSQCFDYNEGQNQKRFINAVVDAFEHWLLPENLRQT